MTDDEAHRFYADPANLAAAGPGQSRQRPRKSAMVAVRFAPAAIAAIKRLTDGGETTVSSWIRRAVDAELDRRSRERPAGPIVAARRGQPKPLRSTLAMAHAGRTFTCPHLSIGNVVSASCGRCGPLSAAA